MTIKSRIAHVVFGLCGSWFGFALFLWATTTGLRWAAPIGAHAGALVLVLIGTGLSVAVGSIAGIAHGIFAEWEANQ